MNDNRIDFPCNLDDESVKFLEEKLEAKINPELATKEDYYRAVFYFKSCGIQEELGDKSSGVDGFSVHDCFFSKEKADVLFEKIYEDALKFDELTVKMSDPANMANAELMSEFEQCLSYGMAAQTAVTNEHLCPKLHILDDEGHDGGNAQLLRTASMGQLSGYFANYPNLQKDLEAAYNTVVVQATAKIDEFLPEGAKKEDFVPIIKEHPKAVTALSYVAKELKANEQKVVIASPQDLLQKCQSPDIVRMADSFSFEDFNGKKLKESAQNGGENVFNKLETAAKNMVKSGVTLNQGQQMFKPIGKDNVYGG